MSKFVAFCLLTVILCYRTMAHPFNPDNINGKTEPLKKLSQIFGVNEHHVKRDHHPPPQYMLDLYRSIADEEGVTKAQNPYNAQIIRSFEEKEQASENYFFFNITGLGASESVIEAELHVYRLKTSGLQPQVLRVYQVTDWNHLHSVDRHQLIDKRFISGPSEGWEVFRVSQAVIEWVGGDSPNRGFLIVASTALGQTVPLRISRRADRHKNRQPVLVLFNKDSTVQEREGQLQLAEASEKNEARRQRRETSRLHSNECHREEMYVDFEAIGWSSWIIAPKGYNAYHCKGICSFPLGQNQKPTNHATVQSIVHEMNLIDGVGRPCCVPSRLLSLSLLYYDENDNVILKQYNDMVAENCGCH